MECSVRAGGHTACDFPTQIRKNGIWLIQLNQKIRFGCTKNDRKLADDPHRRKGVKGRLADTECGDWVGAANPVGKRGDRAGPPYPAAARYSNERSWRFR